MALGTEPEVLALAERLAHSADLLHARLRRALRSGDLTPGAARDLVHAEQLLRQQADALCVAAARGIVSGLALPQRDLLATVEAAQERLRESRGPGALAGLLAALLSLATAVGAAAPEGILAALEQVRRELEESASA